MSGRICYLHVGRGKTGSSAIQYALTKAHAGLLAQGYLYPDATRNFHKVLAGKPTAGNGSRINRALHEDDIEQALDVVRPFAASPQHLVLSCEGFSNVTSENLQAFNAGLRSLGYEAKCLAFFRPQIEVAASSYLQQVKANKRSVNVSLTEYITQRITSKKLERSWNWYVRAQDLEQIFGGTNVTIKWYPAIKRAGPDGLPAIVFAWLGVPSLYEPGHGLSERALVNPTPGQEALIVLRTANSNGLGGRFFADPFLRTAQQQGLLGSKVVLNRADIERIHAATIESNRHLLGKYCPELDAATELALPAAGPEQAMDDEILRKLATIACDTLLQLNEDKDVRKKIKALFRGSKKIAANSDQAAIVRTRAESAASPAAAERGFVE